MTASAAAPHPAKSQEAAPSNAALTLNEKDYSDKFKRALVFVYEHNPNSVYAPKLILVAKDSVELYKHLLPEILHPLFKELLAIKEKDPSLYGLSKPNTQTNTAPSSGQNTNKKLLSGLQVTMNYFQTVWLTRYPLEPYPPTEQALFIKAMGKLIDVVRQSPQPLSSNLKAIAIDWLQDPKHCQDPNTSLLWTLDENDLLLLKNLFIEPNNPNLTIEEQFKNHAIKNQLLNNKERSTLSSIEFAIEKKQSLNDLVEAEIHDAIGFWYNELPEHLKIDLTCIAEVIFQKAGNLKTIHDLFSQTDRESNAKIDFFKKRILSTSDQFDLKKENHIKAYENFLNWLSKGAPDTIQFLIEKIPESPERYNEIKKLAEFTLKHNGGLLIIFNNYFDLLDKTQFTDYAQLAITATTQSPYYGFDYAKQKLECITQEERQLYLELANIAYHVHPDATQHILSILDLNKTKDLKKFTAMAIRIAKTYPSHHDYLAHKIDFNKEDHINLYLNMAKTAIDKFPEHFSTFTSKNPNIPDNVRPRVYKALANYAITKDTPNWYQIFHLNHLDLTQEENVRFLKNLSLKAAEHRSFHFSWLNTAEIIYSHFNPIFNEIFDEINETALRHNGLLLNDIGHKYNLQNDNDLANYTHLAKIAIKQNPAALGAVFFKFHEYTKTPTAEILRVKYQEIEKLLPTNKSSSSIPQNEAWAFRYINSFQKLKENLHQARVAVALLNSMVSLPYQIPRNYKYVFNACNTHYACHNNHMELVKRLGAFLASTYGFDAALAEGLKVCLDLNTPAGLEAFRWVAQWGERPTASKALKMA